MKKCNKCGLNKEHSEFNCHKKKYDGFQAHCKLCQYKYRHKHFEKLKKYELDRRESKINYNHIPQVKYKSYIRSAQSRNYSFSLTFDEFNSIIKKDCYYCGLNDGLNGIDRINNDFGYIDSNCVPCCTKCNHMKWDLTVKEMFSHMLKMLKHTFKGWAFTKIRGQ